MTDVVVIAGMSGAGRTQAGNALEDLGWFVIDNLPVGLIGKLGELVSGPRTDPHKMALIIGAGSPPEQIPDALDELRADGLSVRTMFLDAATDVLIRRYESTRRRHPAAGGGGLGEAIERERRRLATVREQADLVIDTSDLTVHQLRARTVEVFGEDGLGGLMQTAVLSFGYKYGVPSDVDIVIDCRFLPNPYWVEDLRPLSGLDQPVRDYLATPVADEFQSRLQHLMEWLVPQFRDEGKAYLTIALGCTGGRHRSVVMVERLAAALRAMGVEPRVQHRDIDR